ncbi:MAG: 50S ribosomal protein L23 [Lentisphaerae bacterium]|nr:50S ribosomal protein L23 [Lentisphaerota bacterium]
MKNPNAVIRTLLVTEKGTRLQAANKYLFQVAPAANKIEIRHAVEKLFNVHVTGVNTMRVDGKAKRAGRSPRMGRTSDWKKAVVTLKAGEKIDLG